jgi:FMN phosphatase YigB (HAD superfamily)
MARPKVSVLITDLDNTLFDWVDIWGKSFTALVDELVRTSGVDREVLLKEIGEVHQKRRTSEYAFLIEELPSLRAKHPMGDLAQIFDSAIHAHRSARKEAEALYPGVVATMSALKEQGVLIVGYTESMAYYASRRVRVLKLDGLLDYLYSPPDHDMPENLTPDQIRKYPTGYYDFVSTKHRYTPKGELKPNPDILRKIIEDIGAKPEQCVYVGDNLMKDIAMAKDTGVLGAHAEYGHAQDREIYQLLRKVTHWSLEDVEREKAIMAGKTVGPDYVLKGSFAELLALFEFVPFGAAQVEKRIAQYLDVWKKIVDVQQHFNDIEMKIRALALPTLAAMMGAAGYAHKENVKISVLGASFSAASAIAILTFVIWMAFYFLDRHWYHRLLYGAVKANIEIEKAIRTVIPELDLGGHISRESPWTFNLLWITKVTLRSPQKMAIVYWGIAFLIALTTIMFALSGG